MSRMNETSDPKVIKGKKESERQKTVPTETKKGKNNYDRR